MKRLRIMLVDDQKLFVQSLKRAIQSITEDIEDVTIAYNGREAIEIIPASKPDVILMDIYMPVLDGIEATKIIHRQYPDIKILMLTTYGYDEYVKEAIDNGASGYLLKDILPEELIDTVKMICDGKSNVVMSQEIVKQIVKKIEEGKGERFSKESIPRWYRELSEKEKHILLLISKGYSNDEISEKVYLGKQTVRNYISNIYSKLGVDNRFEAMRIAIESGIESLINIETK